MSAGRYARALAQDERALALAIRIDGKDSPAAGQRMNRLALALQALGQHDQALPQFEQALSIARVAEGPDGIDTAIELHNLGRLARLRGDPAGGLPLLEQAYGIAERNHAIEPFVHALMLKSLGDSSLALGDTDRAADYLERALAEGRTAWGAEHLNVGRTLTSLALERLRTNRASDAVPLLEHAERIAEAVGDRDSQWRALSELAEAHARLGDAPAAIALDERAVDAIQSLRADVGTGTDRQRAFLSDKREVYEALAAQLTAANRIEEARRVGRLLADADAFPSLASK